MESSSSGCSDIRSTRYRWVLAGCIWLLSLPSGVPRTQNAVDDCCCACGCSSSLQV
jgi:hypothetical protein